MEPSKQNYSLTVQNWVSQSDQDPLMAHFIDDTDEILTMFETGDNGTISQVCSDILCALGNYNEKSMLNFADRISKKYPVSDGMELKNLHELLLFCETPKLLSIDKEHIEAVKRGLTVLASIIRMSAAQCLFQKPVGTDNDPQKNLLLLHGNPEDKSLVVDKLKEFTHYVKKFPDVPIDWTRCCTHLKLYDLNEDALNTIYSYLNTVDLKALALVCKRIKLPDTSWKALCDEWHKQGWLPDAQPNGTTWKQHFFDNLVKAKLGNRVANSIVEFPDHADFLLSILCISSIKSLLDIVFVNSLNASKGIQQKLIDIGILSKPEEPIDFTSLHLMFYSFLYVLYITCEPFERKSNFHRPQDAKTHLLVSTMSFYSVLMVYTYTDTYVLNDLTKPFISALFTFCLLAKMDEKFNIKSLKVKLKTIISSKEFQNRIGNSVFPFYRIYEKCFSRMTL